MKRVLTIVGLVVLVLVVAVGGVLAATFLGRRSIADGQEVGGARIVADGFSSVGVITVAAREVLLVDAGQSATGAAILAELSRRGLTAESVTAILITHGHQDHTGALKMFPKARVMALEAEAAMVEGREGSHGPVTRLFPVSPTGVTVARRLHDAEIFTVGSASVRVFAMPGHTAGSAAYLVNDVLFVGDSADVSSNGELLGASWIFSDSQRDNRASLRRLAERLRQDSITVKAIVPAHSGPVDGLAALTAFALAN